MVRAAISPAEQDSPAQIRRKAAGATPISGEAAALERAARYLRNAKPALMRHRGRALTFEDARWALEDRAETLRQLADRAKPEEPAA